MEKGNIKINEINIKYCFLKDDENNWMQFWYAIIPEKPEQIKEQIKTIEQTEKKLYRHFHIKKENLAWKRFFSSDLTTHYPEIMDYKRRQETDFSLSLTEQPPLPQVKIAVLGMCLSNITAKSRKNNIFYFDTTSQVKHIFAEHLVDPEAHEHTKVEDQTEKIFSLLSEKLSGFNASIENSVLRTWLYVPHVDADYPGIVKARKDLFNSINLTKDTHYIASTGIQGGSGDRFSRVFMDAYAVTGINEEKIRYIEAPEHLSPTHIYGVTFERATAMEIGKTDFLFISGTASIDKNGDVVHPGDIIKQTERTLENISVLLHSANFSIEHLSSFMIYLRDPADYNFVKPIIDTYCRDLPAIYVQAPVCRPGWLIEIEATAAKVINAGKK